MRLLPLRTLLCLSALFGAGSVARAGGAGTVPGHDAAPVAAAAADHPVGEPAPGAATPWAPYQAEFGEASPWLAALVPLRAEPAHPYGGAGVSADADDDDDDDDDQLAPKSLVAEFYLGMKTLLRALGMGLTPAGTSAGPSAAPAQPVGHLPDPEHDRPGSVERLVLKRQWFRFLVLASRVFRPPRVAGANPYPECFIV